MSGMAFALQQVHEAENAVHGHLSEMIARQHAEHEVHHVSRDLRTWSEEHIRRIAAEAGRHGEELAAEPDKPAPTRHLKEAAATLLGRRPEPGLLLLADLQTLYLLASASSLAWESLAQLAQATRDASALELATQCHPQTLRQVRWANTMIKTQSPQVLASL